MKKLLLFIAMFATLHSFSQESQTAVPLFAGYYGPYLIQPGLKVGTKLELGERTNQEEAKPLYLSPQIGVFTRSGNHTSLVANADLGYVFKKKHGSVYAAPSLGVGYILAQQLLDQSLDLNNGEKPNSNREWRSFFLPTLNLEFGKEPGEKTGWYSKVSYGRKISSLVENSDFFAFEVGMKFLIQIKK
ncbi:MAG: hypothetical protein MRZ79_13830 [Bacteroidia bacterium]|nr:hypothetical protein [Bacteroidia bacterium]